MLTATDAIVAGQCLHEQPVDLLLADIEMPLMDGLALLQAVKSDQVVSSLPVVFVTSHAEYEARARELGAVGYLTKPVRTSELFAVVAQHVKARQRAGSASAPH